MDSGAALPAPGENKEQSSEGAEGEKGHSIRAHLGFHRAQEDIFPQLHFEISVVNMVLDNFYGFIEDHVEVLLPEEKVARNSIIIAETSLQESKKNLEEWQSDTFYTLNNLRLLKSNISSALKR